MTPTQRLTKAFVRSCTLLGLKRTDLVDILECELSAIDDIFDGSRGLDIHEPNYKSACFLIDICKNLSVIVAYDEESIRSWVRSQNYDLGSRPIDLLAQHKFEQVLDYLETFTNRV